MDQPEQPNGQFEEPAPRSMREAEFCERAGISPRTAQGLRAKGKLSHCKVGTRVFYLEEHLTEFFRAHEVKAGATTNHLQLKEHHV